MIDTSAPSGALPLVFFFSFQRASLSPGPLVRWGAAHGQQWGIGSTAAGAFIFPRVQSRRPFIPRSPSGRLHARTPPPLSTLAERRASVLLQRPRAYIRERITEGALKYARPCRPLVCVCMYTRPAHTRSRTHTHKQASWGNDAAAGGAGWWWMQARMNARVRCVSCIHARIRNEKEKKKEKKKERAKESLDSTEGE